MRKHFRNHARSIFNRPRCGSWYKISNKEAEQADVYVYDEIGWFGVTANDFARDLMALEQDIINLHINSPGGDVFDGLTIYNTLHGLDKEVNVVVEGLAASIASVIAMAGDTLTMYESSYLMVHEPWGLAIGTAGEMRELADLLDNIEGTIQGVYTAAGFDEDRIAEAIKAETWMTPEQAQDMGLTVDKVVPNKSRGNNKFDLSVFDNVPDDLLASADTEPKKIDLEKALRDAGLSQREAKAVLADGYDAKDGSSVTEHSKEFASAVNKLYTSIKR